jgi:DNA polymerase III gamma/tau subunit
LFFPYKNQIFVTDCFKRLLLDIKGGNLSHCYLISSADGEFVKHLTKAFSAAIYCKQLSAKDGPCGECLPCRKILAGTHEYVDFFPKEKDKLTPDDVSELKDRLTVSADDEPVLYILSAFDKTSAVTQNKLLKTLEEPSRNTILILLASSPSGVLNTVRSRSREIPCPPLSVEALKTGLIENYYASLEKKTGAEGINASQSTQNNQNHNDQSTQNQNTQNQNTEAIQNQNAAWAASFSGGSIELAEKMLSEPVFLTAFNAVFDFFDNCGSSKDMPVFSEGLLRLDDAETVIEFFSLAVRDLSLYRTGNKKLVLAKDKQESLDRLSKIFDARALIKIQDKIIDSKKRLTASCNPVNVIDGLLTTCLEEKARCQKQ